MSATEELRSEIQTELDELEQFSRQYLMNEIAGGEWYDVLMRAALAGHEPAIDPDLPRVVLATNWLEKTRRLAATEGQLRADAYTPAVASSLGPKGSAGAVPIPDEAMGFVTDLLYTTRMHLRLAHDLCTLHGRTIDIDRAEDLHALVRIAFGKRSGEILYETVRMTLPVIDSQGFLSATEGVDAAVQRSLPGLGQHLLRRNVIKYILPKVAVPLNAALNYYFTVDIAHSAGNVLMESATDPEVLKDLSRLASTSPKLLLESIWLIIVSDEKITADEKKFINTLTLKLTEIEGGEDTIGLIRQLEGVDADTVIRHVSEESDEVKKTLYDVVCDAAAIDHKIHRKERKIVQRFAEACGVPYDLKELKRRAKIKH